LATSEVEVAERHEFDAGGMLGHESTYVVNVSEQIALAVPAFYGCVRIIADLVSDGDVRELRGTELLNPSRLALRPMATMTRRQWIWLCVASMVIYNGVWLWNRLGRDSDGVPLSVIPIAPPRVSWDGKNRRIDGEIVNDSDMTFVPRAVFPTVNGDLASLIRLARDAIAAAWAAESYRADFWQAGGMPSYYIKTEQPLSNDQAVDLQTRWIERRTENPGAPPVVGRGGEIKLLTTDIAGGSRVTADEIGTAIAQYCGVPGWLAMVPNPAGSLVYQNASAAGLDLVRYNLRPGYAGPLGDAWSEFLPGGYLTGRRIEIGLEHLTRGTTLEEAQRYAIATGNARWMLPSEVRNELRLPIDMTLDEQGTPAPAMENIPAEESNV
jgi:phage portal protein BeeE